MKGVFMLCSVILIFGLFSIAATSRTEAFQIELKDENIGIEPGEILWQRENATYMLVELVNKTDRGDEITIGGIGSDIDWTEIGKSIRLQPCRRFDSCKARCLDFPRNTAEIAETEQFNCNCDPDCTVFGDCCWDYHEECDMLNQNEKGLSSFNVMHGKKPGSRPRADAFECIVVDKYSKEYFWVVTKCATNWPDDDIKHRCVSGSVDFTALLPVQGDTGWTYRNAFCAQCNYVKNFEYWKIYARCFQSAPEEVLRGSSEMISYYLLHFCNIQVARNQDVLKRYASEEDQENENGINRESSLKYNLPIRRCDNEMIRTCPADYHDPFIEALCESYQSLIIHREYVDGAMKHKIFKNPICAYCHGIGRGIDPHPDTMPSYPSGPPNIPGDFNELSWRASSGGKAARQLECPIWLGTVYYDLPYWSLSVLDDTRSMLPKFSSTRDTKSQWTPPSFSMLLHFRQDGSNDIYYTEGGNSSCKSITPDTTCDIGQIYDPFYALCRPVLCDPDENFTGSSCMPVDSHQQQTNINQAPSVPVAATITLMIEIPTEHYPTNSSQTAFSANLKEEVRTSVAQLYNTNDTDVIIVNVTILGVSDSTGAFPAEDEKAKGDNSVTFAFTFVLVDPEDYTDAQIIEFVEQINSYVQFQKLLLEADFLTVVVLSTPKIGQIPITCADGTKKLQYSAGQYEVIEYEGRIILYVNSTDEYYLESEYQFLDWTLKISENGTERTYDDDSRVIVCAEIPEVLVCDIYVPLNQTEYTILNNGSLYMNERDVMLLPEEYISYEDTVAVCADHYTTNNTVTNLSDKPEIESKSLWLIVGVWLTFALSMLCLVSLAVTFITYLLFRDLRTVAGCCIMNLAIAQFSAVALFIFGANATSNPVACTAVAVVLHYLFLSIFFWNNVVAFDVWRIFGQGLKSALRRSVQNRLSLEGKPSDTGRIVYKYMVYAWGIPAVIVAVSAAIEFGTDSISVGYEYDPTFSICWISNATANIVVFGIPVFLILLINGFFFILSIIAIRKSTNAPLTNVGKTGNPFRRTLASVTDEVRTHEANTEANCVSYKKRGSISESCSEPDKPSRMSSLSSVDENYSTRESKANGNGMADGKRRSDPTLRAVSVLSRRQSKSSVTASPETRMSTKRARSNVLVYVKMSTVMGFSWIIGFAAAFSQAVVLWVLFEVSVPLQGILIFCAFVCKKRIFRKYKKFFSTCCGGKGIGSRRPSQETPRKPTRQAMSLQRRQNASSSSLDDVFEAPKSITQWRTSASDTNFESCITDAMRAGMADEEPSFKNSVAESRRNACNRKRSPESNHECHVNVAYTSDSTDVQESPRPNAETQ